jgi:hypothetical protein
VPADDAPADGEDGDRASWGSREVEILDVVVAGPGGPTDRFVTGEPFVIEMRVRARHRVPTPRFGISIRSDEGALCFGTNTQMDSVDVDAIEGDATIRYQVPALPLHDGRFTLTLGVASRDGRDIYHWLDRWIAFSVFPRRTGTGLVEFAGEWALETTPSLAGTAGEPAT